MKGADAEANYADPDALALPSGGYRLCVGEAGEHQIVSFFSRDGVVWIREEGTRVTRAAFPDAVLLPDGRVRLYYQQFSQEQRTMVIKSAISTDSGFTFAEEPGVRVAPGWHGERDPDRVAGSSTVLLPDGRYRMYYIGGSRDDAYFNGMKNVVLSAISEDGLQWEPEEGVRVAPEDWVDVAPPHPELGQRKRSWIASPEAVLTPDGQTKLYFWGICHGVCLSTSADGVRFERVEQVFSNDQLPVAGNAGDPAILRLADGTWLLFYNSLQNGYQSIYIARWKAGDAQPSQSGYPSPTPSPHESPALTPTLLGYGAGAEEGKAVFCRHAQNADPGPGRFPYRSDHGYQNHCHEEHPSQPDDSRKQVYIG